MTNPQPSPITTEQRRADWDWLEAEMRAALVEGVTDQPVPLADDQTGDEA